MLNLSGNPFDGGSVPSWLGDLSSLRYLYLDDGAWAGAVPATLANLAELERLSLGGNAFAAAPLPAWLAGMTSLTDLYVDGNGWTGSVPSWLGDLSSLQYLYLGYNPLTGPLPQSLTQLGQLEHLSFSGTTSVCAPSDASFQSWLSSLAYWDGDLCDGSGARAQTVYRAWMRKRGGF